MSIIQAIHHLYQKTFGSSPAELIPLKRTASGRHYFRIVDADKTYIATYGADPKENEAFIYFSKHFKEKGMPVPEIFAVDSEQGIYLQEDLGSQSLYDLLPEAKEDLGENLKAIYKKVLTQLARLQIKGGQGLDYSKCVPHSDFDRQSMYWDLNYFKYFFLKLSTVTFDEAALEKDFQGLMDFLLQADRTHFMYRDFQSRNIMIRQGQPYFVDYQGGRRGALQYDVASLLYQPAAAMSEATREELLKHYLEEVAQHKTIDVGSFMQLFYAYVLIRRLQALGTYGLRGIHERYTHFLKSIPIALAQIRSLFDENKIAIPLPE
ncbi:MAG TPA: phosphotransferase enzyme family protein, partial [Phaeodactylibacter sp.]|nr:phosphotransferase enzyme family protein [Phaeodactylibacter sp.]